MDDTAHHLTLPLVMESNMSIISRDIDRQDAEALIDWYGREAAGEALLRAIERHLARDARAARYWMDVAQETADCLATCCAPVTPHH
jgi:hypothetical protein